MSNKHVFLDLTLSHIYAYNFLLVSGLIVSGVAIRIQPVNFSWGSEELTEAEWLHWTALLFKRLTTAYKALLDRIECSVAQKDALWLRRVFWRQLRFSRTFWSLLRLGTNEGMNYEELPINQSPVDFVRHIRHRKVSLPDS